METRERFRNDITCFILSLDLDSDGALAAEAEW